MGDSPRGCHCHTDWLRQGSIMEVMLQATAREEKQAVWLALCKQGAEQLQSGTYFSKQQHQQEHHSPTVGSTAPPTALTSTTSSSAPSAPVS